ncbi:MAG TPA: transglutaminase-like domain-containing protein [Thermoanaerobaculia bacterium]|jgi:transglutaminase-like putative cysteine protease|nr:transglutaminase-like domain-containing protein [Thermoanaerobaculia bacterium]
MNRRDFIRTAGAASAALAFPGSRLVFARTRGTTTGAWRTFEVTTRAEILKPAGSTRVWLPAALIGETPFQRTLSNDFRADGGRAELVERKEDALGIVAAVFPDGAKPVLTLTSRVQTRDYAVDPSAPPAAPAATPAELRHFLRASAYMPTDGLVKSTAESATIGAKTDVEKARALYDWLVDNTFRDPKVQGCGIGNVANMLETKNLGGKCADLNALYVALARAAGLPARDVYGIRVASSALGYKSLGAATENVTKAQHCRAEVYLEGRWVPVDPADVRKVVLEEPPGNRPMDDAMVAKARARLFGSWEMNWMAYNFAHEVALPGASGPPLVFFMYPQAETADGRLDCLDPASFKYEIVSREVA